MRYARTFDFTVRNSGGGDSKRNLLFIKAGATNGSVEEMVARGVCVSMFWWNFFDFLFYLSNEKKKMCAESRSHQMTETKTYEFAIVLLSFQGIHIEAANDDTDILQFV